MDKEKLSAAVAVVIAFALVIAMLGSWKKDIVVNEIVELDIEDIVMDESLPEIVFDEAILPEILPPLYEEPLPPLQGEV
jgi:hypothetical protein